MQDTEAIWSGFRHMLGDFVARRLPDRADVDDVVQEVFVRVHRRLDGQRDRDRLVPWLLAITRNVIADHHRAPARRREVLTEPDEAGAAAPPAEPAGDPRAELARCLGPMIERLPEPYREALALVELRGLSQVEAAARLGLSVSGAKSRVQRGRRMLRDLVVACCDVSLGARSDVTDFTLRRGASCGGCGPTAT